MFVWNGTISLANTDRRRHTLGIGCWVWKSGNSLNEQGKGAGSKGAEGILSPGFRVLRDPESITFTKHASLFSLAWLSLEEDPSLPSEILMLKWVSHVIFFYLYSRWSEEDFLFTWIPPTQTHHPKLWWGDNGCSWLCELTRFEVMPISRKGFVSIVECPVCGWYSVSLQSKQSVHAH